MFTRIIQSYVLLSFILGGMFLQPVKQVHASDYSDALKITGAVLGGLTIGYAVKYYTHKAQVDESNTYMTTLWSNNHVKGVNDVSLTISFANSSYQKNPSLLLISEPNKQAFIQKISTEVTYRKDYLGHQQIPIKTYLVSLIQKEKSEIGKRLKLIGQLTHIPQRLLSYFKKLSQTKKIVDLPSYVSIEYLESVDACISWMAYLLENQPAFFNEDFYKELDQLKDVHNKSWRNPFLYIPSFWSPSTWVVAPQSQKAAKTFIELFKLYINICCIEKIVEDKTDEVSLKEKNNTIAYNNISNQFSVQVSPHSTTDQFKDAQNPKKRKQVF